MYALPLLTCGWPRHVCSVCSVHLPHSLHLHGMHYKHVTFRTSLSPTSLRIWTGNSLNIVFGEKPFYSLGDVFFI
jgi:hypothetical protein